MFPVLSSLQTVYPLPTGPEGYKTRRLSDGSRYYVIPNAEIVNRAPYRTASGSDRMPDATCPIQNREQ